jgi:DNA-directed RNA polymerase specialized sigma24 family protein
MCDYLRAGAYSSVDSVFSSARDITKSPVHFQAMNMFLKTRKQKNQTQDRHDMSAYDDANRLANLLEKQREATIAVRHTLRNECLELVDCYFRQTLRPVLAGRFPGKGLQSAPVNETVHSNDAMFRYTELMNDFFVQVLSRFDDPFWQKHSAIELRNYASISISNRGVRDVLRRRKKQQPLTDEQVKDSFDELLAADIESRFTEAGLEIDPADTLEILEHWRNSANDELQKSAMLLRHQFISGMTMQQIADDMDAPLTTVYRWRTQAVAAMRKALNEKDMA